MQQAAAHRAPGASFALRDKGRSKQRGRVIERDREKKRESEDGGRETGIPTEEGLRK